VTRQVFEPLQPYHDREAFDCGKQSLNQFLQRQARQNADRNVGVTHVAVPCSGSNTIIAYYTLVTRTVDSVIVPNKKLPREEVGVVLLGRLAVDRTAQGQGLGRLCLMRAIFQVERASREIGIHALVLDALDDEARSWYFHLDLGFQALLDNARHLYLPVATIRQIADAR
jgi:GNAT superfamily N-acetyltransferase